MAHTIISDNKLGQLESILPMITRWIFKIVQDVIIFLQKRPCRRLAGIFYADVSNYTGMSEKDEDGTHVRLMTYIDIIKIEVRAFNGRTVNLAGDAVLAEFGNICDMMCCALSVQRMFKEANASYPPPHQIQFRIGINLGEIISNRGDIYGNAVNIAARLEHLAEPGGIAISESVRTSVGNLLPINYILLGEKQVKNIEEPLRVYHVEIQTDEIGIEDSKKIVQFPTNIH